MSLLEYPVLRDKVALTRTLAGRRVLAQSIKRLPRNHFFRNLFPSRESESNPNHCVRACVSNTVAFTVARIGQASSPSSPSPEDLLSHRDCSAAHCSSCRAHCNCSESLTLSPNPCNSRFRKSRLPTPTLPPRLASPAHSKIENG